MRLFKFKSIPTLTAANSLSKHGSHGLKSLKQFYSHLLLSRLLISIIFICRFPFVGCLFFITPQANLNRCPNIITFALCEQDVFFDVFHNHISCSVLNLFFVVQINIPFDNFHHAFLHFCIFCPALFMKLVPQKLSE